jgi:hypothetical protein
VPKDSAVKDAALATGWPWVKVKSRKRGAVVILASIGYEFCGDGVLMNIVLMVSKIVGIANPMIGESALSDFSVSSANSAERMGVPALD